MTNKPAVKRDVAGQLRHEAAHVESANSYGADVLAPLLREAADEIEALASAPSAPQECAECQRLKAEATTDRECFARTIAAYVDWLTRMTTAIKGQQWEGWAQPEDVEQLKTDLVVLRSNRCQEHPEQHLVPACLACWRRDAAQPSASQEEPTQATLTGLIEKLTIDLWQAICEMPDRTSPEGDPDAAVVTLKELGLCVENVVGDALEALSSSAPAETTTDCRADEGVTVGLIDSIITAARVLATRNLSGSAITEALKDMRSDGDVRRMLAPAQTQEERANRFDCPQCGQGIAVDEDGCCRSCGADAKPVLAQPSPETPAKET